MSACEITLKVERLKLLPRCSLLIRAAQRPAAPSLCRGRMLLQASATCRSGRGASATSCPSLAHRQGRVCSLRHLPLGRSLQRVTVPVLAVQPWFVSVLGLCMSSPSQLHPPAFSTALGLGLLSLGRGGQCCPRGCSRTVCEAEPACADAITCCVSFAGATPSRCPQKTLFSPPASSPQPCPRAAGVSSKDGLLGPLRGGELNFFCENYARVFFPFLPSR